MNRVSEGARRVYKDFWLCARWVEAIVKHSIRLSFCPWNAVICRRKIEELMAININHGTMRTQYISTYHYSSLVLIANAKRVLYYLQRHTPPLVLWFCLLWITIINLSNNCWKNLAYSTFHTIEMTESPRRIHMATSHCRFGSYSQWAR